MGKETNAISNQTHSGNVLGTLHEQKQHQLGQNQLLKKNKRSGAPGRFSFCNTQSRSWRQLQHGNRNT